jgi:cell division topological specificity factor
MIQFGEMINDIISRCNRLISATLNSKEEGSNSKEDACNRLKLVLMHDRSKLPPATLEKMRDELVKVISKYVEIDKETLDLNLASEGNSIALVASIPVLRHKKQEEIDAAEKAEIVEAEITETTEETQAIENVSEAGSLENNEITETVDEVIEPESVPADNEKVALIEETAVSQETKELTNNPFCSDIKFESEEKENN